MANELDHVLTDDARTQEPPNRTNVQTQRKSRVSVRISPQKTQPTLNPKPKSR